MTAKEHLELNPELVALKERSATQALERLAQGLQDGTVVSVPRTARTASPESTQVQDIEP